MYTPHAFPPAVVYMVQRYATLEPLIIEYGANKSGSTRWNLYLFVFIVCVADTGADVIDLAIGEVVLTFEIVAGLIQLHTYRWICFRKSRLM